MARLSGVGHLGSRGGELTPPAVRNRHRRRSGAPGALRPPASHWINRTFSLIERSSMAVRIRGWLLTSSARHRSRPPGAYAMSSGKGRPGTPVKAPSMRRAFVGVRQLATHGVQFRFHFFHTLPQLVLCGLDARQAFAVRGQRCDVLGTVPPCAQTASPQCASDTRPVRLALSQYASGIRPVQPAWPRSEPCARRSDSCACLYRRAAMPPALSSTPQAR